MATEGMREERRAGRGLALSTGVRGRVYVMERAHHLVGGCLGEGGVRERSVGSLQDFESDTMHTLHLHETNGSL
jgi:hypothetical protein